MNTPMKSRKLWWPVDPKGYSIVKGERKHAEDGHEPEPGELFLVSKQHLNTARHFNSAYYESPSELTEKDRRQLREFLSDDEHHEDRYYDPMQCDNLFIRFANIETTEDLICFANQFGNLGRQVVFNCKIEDRKTVCTGFRLLKAFGHIGNYKRCYQNWLDIKRGGEDEHKVRPDLFLRLYDVPLPIMRTLEFRPPREENGIYYMSGPESDWFKPDLSPAESARAFNWAHLGAEVTAHLYKETSLNLMLNEGNDGLSLSFSPESLLGSIWLQFALTLTSNDRWKLCEYCGEPFRFKSAKREYCSESHRSLAHRRRKREATKG